MEEGKCPTCGAKMVAVDWNLELVGEAYVLIPVRWSCTSRWCENYDSMLDLSEMNRQAPTELFLQIQDASDGVIAEIEEATWHWERVHESDIIYVRIPNGMSAKDAHRLLATVRSEER